MIFFEYATYFFIYGFLGWCTEVAFAAIKERRFVNRGFLNGPLCPIYGIGVVSVTGLLAGLKGQFFLLYIASVVLVTTLEWLTGFILEKIFHHKWWDYSGMPFNLNGYVCLTFSLIWGVACMFIVKVLHPLIEHGVGFLHNGILIFLIIILGIAMFADLYVTASGILKFNKHLEKMDAIARELHEFSEDIGENIYKGVMESLEKHDERLKRWDELSEETRERLNVLSQEGKQHAEKLHETYRELAEKLAEKNIKHAKRLLKAFPHLESKNYKETLNSIRELLNRK